MSRRFAVSIVIIVSLATLCLYFLLHQDGQPTGSADLSSTTVANEPTGQAEPNSPQQGTYVEYSETTLAQAAGERILFFHASWCPQCRALEADIEKQGVPSGVTIFKVDYDNAQDLRKKYGVTLQTTVVKIDENGNLVSKFTPYNKPTLQNALGNL